MKLLFDQNLSFRLIAALEDLYPGSAHVRLLGMEAVDDEVIWEYATTGNAQDFRNARFAGPGFACGTEPNAFLVSQRKCPQPETRILRLDETLTEMSEGPYHRGGAAVVRLVLKH